MRFKLGDKVVVVNGSYGLLGPGTMGRIRRRVTNVLNKNHLYEVDNLVPNVGEYTCGLFYENELRLLEERVSKKDCM